MTTSPAARPDRLPPTSTDGTAGTDGALRGEPVVLVPRGGEWGDRVAGLLTAWGARAWVLPLIRTEATDDPELSTARTDLAAGCYDWVALTSAAAVPALPPTVRARIAAVGPTTASALREAGYAVDLVPDGPDYSAEAMLTTWHPAGRVLLLHSDLAGPDLADGLRAGGAQVREVIAYRTRDVVLSSEQESDLRRGHAAIALVTSGSVARALAAGGVASSTRIACLGPRTADAARECGLRVDLVAESQQIEALIDAVRGLLRPAGDTRSAPAPMED